MAGGEIEDTQGGTSMFTKSNTLKLFVLPLALVAGLGATMAVAGPGGPPGLHGPLPLHHLDRMADELGLTEDQRTAIRTVVEESKAQGEQLRAEHEGLREEGLALFTAAELDPVAIEAHRQQMLDAADAGTALMSDTMLQVAQILTPDQRVLLADKVEQFHAEGGVRERIRSHMRERHDGERGRRSR